MSQRIHHMVLLIMIATLIVPVPTASSSESDHPDVERFVGHWRWIHSADFVGGTGLTPDTEGYTEEWVLNSDGTYQILWDDEVLLAGTWCVTECVPTERNVGYCNGQMVLQFRDDDRDPEFAVIDYDYSFCAGERSCWPVYVDYAYAIQVIGHAQDAYLSTYEWATEVPLEASSWGTLKSSFGEQ